MNAPDTTIVVPCYDEAERFDAAAFDAYLERAQSVGFVLVDDGSRDRTLDLLDGLAARWPGRVRVVELGRNQGKAEAVRAGVQAALVPRAPRYVGYWDADLATPLLTIDDARRILEDRPDIELVMGARVALLGRTIERRPYRHYLGRVFATAASAVLGLPVYDTQCGAKLFRVTERTAGLFDAPFSSRWVFDVELLARLVEARGDAQGIFELPLHTWRDVGASKVRPTDFVRAAGDLAGLYRRHAWPRHARRLRARWGSRRALQSR